MNLSIADSVLLMIGAVTGSETHSAKMAPRGSHASVCGLKKQKLCIKLTFVSNDPRLETHVPNWSLVSELMNLIFTCAARPPQKAKGHRSV